MRAAKMSERRRSAVALSSRAHAFSVEALIGSNKKRKLRDWEEKGLDLSMEALSPAGPLGDTEDAAAHGLEPHPGECAGPDRGRRAERGRRAASRRAEWCGRRPCSLTPCLAPTRVSFSLRKRLEPCPNPPQTIWGELSLALSSPTSGKEASLASLSLLRAERTALVFTAERPQAPGVKEGRRSKATAGAERGWGSLQRALEDWRGVLGLDTQSREVPSLSHLAFDLGPRPSPTNFSGTQVLVFPVLRG